MHQTNCIETPQQNAIVERKHQHIFNVVRSLLLNYDVPIIFWSYAIIHAVYIINRIPSTVIKGNTPYELLHKETLDLTNLKTFGSLCFISTLERNRSKLDPRAKKYVFLGYREGTKGYVTLDIKTRETAISINIIFYENIFPYKEKQSTDINNQEQNNFNTLFEEPIKQDIIDNDIHNQQIGNIKLTRDRKTPAFLNDYYYNLVGMIDNKKIKYPISDAISYRKLSQKHTRYSLTLSINFEPRNYDEAERNPKWRKAIAKEIEALTRNNTWIVTDLPHNKKPIGCKWVYKIKHKVDGSVERNKARLVAKGYNQLEGIDYLETFSPVVKLTTVRTLLVVVVKKVWFLKQLDVDNAYLHSDLNEDVYMLMPSRMEIQKENQVCKLKKIIIWTKAIW